MMNHEKNNNGKRTFTNLAAVTRALSTTEGGRSYLSLTLLFCLYLFLFGCVSGGQSQYQVRLSGEAKQALQAESEGDYGAALKHYQTALEQYQKDNTEMGELLCLERMGWLNREIGNYSLALRQFEKAYPLGKKLNGDAAEIDADLGDVYLFTGDNIRAKKHYQKALATLKGFVFPTSYNGPPSASRLSELIRKSKAIIHSRVNLGMLYMFSGRHTKALSELNEAERLLLDIEKVAKDPVYGMVFTPNRDFYEGYGFTYTVKGASLAALGRQQEAWSAFDKGIAAFEKGKKEYGLIVNRALRFREEFRAGYEVSRERLRAFDELLEQAEEFGAVEVVWRMAHELGRELKRRKQKEAARSYLIRAVDSLELTRSRLREDSIKQLFASRSQDVYRDLISVLYDLGRFEEGFEYLERSRSRAFLDILGGREVKAKPSVDPGLVKLNRQLVEQMEGLVRKMKLSSVDARKPLRKEYLALREERNDVLRKIRNQSLEYAATTTVSIVPVSEVMRRLGTKEAVLSFFLDHERIVVWIVTSNKVHAVATPLQAGEIEELVADYRDAIKSGQHKLLQEAAADLSKKLMLPIAKHIKGYTALFVVPTKSLNYLPFAALSLDGGYLVDECAVTVLPNASSLQYFNRTVTENRDRLFAVGNPALKNDAQSLKFAEQEVMEIGQRFPRQILLTGKKGLETTIKQTDYSDIGYVHLAVHGRYDLQQPLRSALRFSSDDKNDGDLETIEVFGLHIPARLAVLSACESGVGKLGGGDEVNSLNRAFLYAGVGGVVSSLWKVDDRSTYEFMRLFYRHLAAEAPAIALRNAQLDLRKKYASPYYWAPFYLTGGLVK